MGRKTANEGAEGTAEDELDGLEVSPVIDRADGFFGVEGMNDQTYYKTHEEAARVARNVAISKRARLNGRD